jgi:hypothetical protein
MDASIHPFPVKVPHATPTRAELVKAEAVCEASLALLAADLLDRGVTLSQLEAGGFPPVVAVAMAEQADRSVAAIWDASR